MPTGRVKWFNDLKGYGFITSSDDYVDLYVHHTEIKINGYKTLKEGDAVEFEVAKAPEGLKARNVVLIN